MLAFKAILIQSCHIFQPKTECDLMAAVKEQLLMKIFPVRGKSAQKL